MKSRLISEIKKLSCVLLIGFVYYLIVKFTGFAIPCIFYKTTGLLCPGCGITRMIVAALNFDFAAAFSYNKMLFVTLPIIGCILIYNEIVYIVKGTRSSKYTEPILYIEIVLLVIFCIVRNLV